MKKNVLIYIALYIFLMSLNYDVPCDVTNNYTSCTVIIILLILIKYIAYISAITTFIDFSISCILKKPITFGNMTHLIILFIYLLLVLILLIYFKYTNIDIDILLEKNKNILIDYKSSLLCIISIMLVTVRILYEIMPQCEYQ